MADSETIPALEKSIAEYLKVFGLYDGPAESAAMTPGDRKNFQAAQTEAEKIIKELAGIEGDKDVTDFPEKITDYTGQSPNLPRVLRMRAVVGDNSSVISKTLREKHNIPERFLNDPVHLKRLAEIVENMSGYVKAKQDYNAALQAATTEPSVSPHSPEETPAVVTVSPAPVSPSLELSADVAAVEQTLASLGFDPGTQDGLADARFATARNEALGLMAQTFGLMMPEEGYTPDFGRQLIEGRDKFLAERPDLLKDMRGVTAAEVNGAFGEAYKSELKKNNLPEQFWTRMPAVADAIENLDKTVASLDKIPAGPAAAQSAATVAAAPVKSAEISAADTAAPESETGLEIGASGGSPAEPATGETPPAEQASPAEINVVPENQLSPEVKDAVKLVETQLAAMKKLTNKPEQVGGAFDTGAQKALREAIKELGNTVNVDVGDGIYTPELGQTLRKAVQESGFSTLVEQELQAVGGIEGLERNLNLMHENGLIGALPAPPPVRPDGSMDLSDDQIEKLKAVQTYIMQNGKGANTVEGRTLLNAADGQWTQASQAAVRNMVAGLQAKLKATGDWNGAADGTDVHNFLKEAQKPANLAKLKDSYDEGIADFLIRLQVLQDQGVLDSWPSDAATFKNGMPKLNPFMLKLIGGMMNWMNQNGLGAIGEMLNAYLKMTKGWDVNDLMAAHGVDGYQAGPEGAPDKNTLAGIYTRALTAAGNDPDKLQEEVMEGLDRFNILNFWDDDGQKAAARQAVQTALEKAAGADPAQQAGVFAETLQAEMEKYRAGPGAQKPRTEHDPPLREDRALTLSPELARFQQSTGLAVRDSYQAYNEEHNVANNGVDAPLYFRHEEAGQEKFYVAGVNRQDNRLEIHEIPTEMRTADPEAFRKEDGTFNAGQFRKHLQQYETFTFIEENYSKGDSRIYYRITDSLGNDPILADIQREFGRGGTPVTSLTGVAGAEAPAQAAETQIRTAEVPGAAIDPPADMEQYRIADPNALAVSEILKHMHKDFGKETEDIGWVYYQGLTEGENPRPVHFVARMEGGVPLVYDITNPVTKGRSEYRTFATEAQAAKKQAQAEVTITAGRRSGLEGAAAPTSSGPSPQLPPIDLIGKPEGAVSPHSPGSPGIDLIARSEDRPELSASPAPEVTKDAQPEFYRQMAGALKNGIGNGDVQILETLSNGEPKESEWGLYWGGKDTVYAVRVHENTLQILDLTDHRNDPRYADILANGRDLPGSAGAVEYASRWVPAPEEQDEPPQVAETSPPPPAPPPAQRQAEPFHPYRDQYRQGYAHIFRNNDGVAVPREAFTHDTTNGGYNPADVAKAWGLKSGKPLITRITPEIWDELGRTELGRETQRTIMETYGPNEPLVLVSVGVGNTGLFSRSNVVDPQTITTQVYRESDIRNGRVFFESGTVPETDYAWAEPYGPNAGGVTQYRMVQHGMATDPHVRGAYQRYGETDNPQDFINAAFMQRDAIRRAMDERNPPRSTRWDSGRTGGPAIRAGEAPPHPHHGGYTKYFNEHGAAPYMQRFLDFGQNGDSITYPVPAQQAMLGLTAAFDRQADPADNGGHPGCSLSEPAGNRWDNHSGTGYSPASYS